MSMPMRYYEVKKNSSLLPRQGISFEVACINLGIRTVLISDITPENEEYAHFLAKELGKANIHPDATQGEIMRLTLAYEIQEQKENSITLDTQETELVHLNLN